MLRFLYLNIYSLFFVIAGILICALPFYKINVWIFPVQAILAIISFRTAGKLFATWSDKKRKIIILVNRNRKVFKPETFRVFMQAPCGRLIVRSALVKLGKSYEYKNLLKMKKPFLEQIKDNCAPVKTVIYINEDAL